MSFGMLFAVAAPAMVMVVVLVGKNINQLTRHVMDFILSGMP